MFACPYYRFLSFLDTSFAGVKDHAFATTFSSPKRVFRRVAMVPFRKILNQMMMTSQVWRIRTIRRWRILFQVLVLPHRSGTRAVPGRLCSEPITSLGSLQIATVVVQSSISLQNILIVCSIWSPIPTMPSSSHHWYPSCSKTKL